MKYTIKEKIFYWMMLINFIFTYILALISGIYCISNWDMHWLTFISYPIVLTHMFVAATAMVETTMEEWALERMAKEVENVKIFVDSGSCFINKKCMEE